MDISSLKFDINNKEQYVKDCYAILENVEPYDESVFISVEYDGTSALEDERVLATLAKRFLIKNGYEL